MADFLNNPNEANFNDSSIEGCWNSNKDFISNNLNEVLPMLAERNN